MAWWMPVLAALGVNAGKNVLTGKNPLDNALGAGIAGGITGGLAGTTAGTTDGLLGNAIPGAEVSSIVPGSIESAGMTNVGGTFYNPDYFVGESLGVPTYTGGQGLLSNAADDVGSMLGNLTPENLSGVASLLNEQQDTGQYRQMAGTGGGVKQGSGQGLSVQMPQAKIFKRRKV